MVDYKDQKQGATVKAFARNKQLTVVVTFPEEAQLYTTDDLLALIRVSLERPWWVWHCLYGTLDKDIAPFREQSCL